MTRTTLAMIMGATAVIGCAGETPVGGDTQGASTQADAPSTGAATSTVATTAPGGDGTGVATGVDTAADTAPDPDGSSDGGSTGAVSRGEVRFVALGDAGEGNENQAAVGQMIATVCEERGCDFALYLGDNFYDTGVDSA